MAEGILGHCWKFFTVCRSDEIHFAGMCVITVDSSPISSSEALCNRARRSTPSPKNLSPDHLPWIALAAFLMREPAIDPAKDMVKYKYVQF